MTQVKIEGQARMGVSSIAMRDAVVYRGAECSENAVVHPARWVDIKNKWQNMCKLSAKLFGLTHPFHLGW
eukprot:42616-Eustigmatos_ZCMA.PRE.1